MTSEFVQRLISEVRIFERLLSLWMRQTAFLPGTVTSRQPFQPHTRYKAFAGTPVLKPTRTNGMFVKQHLIDEISALLGGRKRFFRVASLSSSVIV